ncbi:MAG: hypothetical protein K7J15_03455, partial [Candidatus Regiella insecticola]|nr:hypothetical protein [Candidatus Regiella insecticola]
MRILLCPVRTIFMYLMLKKVAVRRAPLALHNELRFRKRSTELFFTKQVISDQMASFHQVIFFRVDVSRVSLNHDKS